MSANINTKYNNKKKNAKGRNIDFQLTLEEFEVLHNSSNKCTYTGVTFDSNKNIKSIERIDKNKGYTKDNCCLVTVLANQLKDTYIDEKVKYTESHQHYSLIEKIKATIESSKTANLVCNKYPHRDVEVAQHYINFSRNKDNFNISLSMFKKLKSRKTCMITGKPLTTSVIRKINNQGGWEDDNIHVILIDVSNILNKLTVADLNKVINHLESTNVR